MADGLHLWLRQEASAVEERAPVVPGDAAALVGSGIAVTVEEAPQRALPVEEYAAAGCRIVPAGSWPDAPADAVVLGLKEPPAQTWPLRHTHVFFGHAYKGQAGGREVLRRFVAGGGTLLDLDARLRESSGSARALVIGALGRSGRGALDAFAVAGMPTTAWDVEETREL